MCGNRQISPLSPPTYPSHLKTKNFPDLETICDCTAVGNEVVKREKKEAHVRTSKIHTENTQVYFLFGVRDISVQVDFWASSRTAHVTRGQEQCRP